MQIWKNQPTLELLNKTGENTLVDHLNIQFIEIGDDYLKASMPVDKTTVQPMRLLHGGASAVLAETIGSVASFLCVDTTKESVVGVEINANHLSPAHEGDIVTATVRPIKVGRQLHVWDIKIHRSDGRQICVSRLTIAVVDKR